MATDLKQFKSLLLPPGEGVAEVLCSQPKEVGLFGVFKLADGSYAACWEAHSQKCDSLDDLRGYLNKHELALLQYGVKD